MMSSSVERWLQSFMCSQYACIFEAYGYKTLHSVCHLQLPHLLAMGVPRNHCEKILENVNNLRQTMFGQIPKPADSDFCHFSKYNPSLNPAVWALKTVAMNANYRGMNPYPEEYSAYGQSGNNMQTMGFHQGSYENANMAMMNPMSGAGGGGYPVPGYDTNQPHMMMSGQGQMAAHSAMYQQQSQQAYMAQQQQQYYASSSGGNTGSSGGQYPTQPYPMQGGANMPAMGGSSQYYSAGNSQGPSGQGPPASGSKMVPPPHHHLRNTSGQQNPQQVADNILQMASSFPSHHTVQVPLKIRHAPYQIPRSPQNYYPEKGGGQQQNLGNQTQQVMSSQQSMVGQQAMSAGQLQTKTSQPQGQMVQASGMGQQTPMRYAGSSPHSQMPPRSSPMSPQMMASPVAGHQARSLSSPSALHSPSSATICSPVPSSPSLANMRSPCSVPMRSPAHMSSGYSCQPMNSPPQRPYAASDSSIAAQHCSPTSMHSPASHGSSPYAPAGMAQHVSSPPQSHVYSAPTHSPYKMDMLMDSGQGPGGQSSQRPRGQGSDPLQSLQKLVMLPETQVVDPKSVVSDGCLQNSDEGSKNSEGPAEQSREAVDCSAGVSVVTCSPPTSDGPTPGDKNKPVESVSPCKEDFSPLFTDKDSAGQADGGNSPAASNSVTSEVSNLPGCSISVSESQERVQSTASITSEHTPHSTSLAVQSQEKLGTKSNSAVLKLTVKNISTSDIFANESSVSQIMATELDTTAAGSSETKIKITGCNESPEKSSSVRCNGLVMLTESSTHKSDAVLSSPSTSSASSVSDNWMNVSEVRPEHAIEDNVNKVLQNSPKCDKDLLTTKKTVKPSPPKMHPKQRLSPTSSVKSVTESDTVAVTDTNEKAPESSFTTDSKTVLQTFDISSKSRLVNGFSEKHNGTESSDIIGKNFHQNNHLQRKSKDRQQSSSSFEFEKVSEVKLVTKHKSRDFVPTRGTCVVTAINGHEDPEMISNIEEDLRDSDSETEVQTGSNVPYPASSVSGIDLSCSAENVNQHPGSDDEDDSLSNGLDFGYDSPPPCEMLGDDNWKPDLEKRLSANGVDEADGNRDCTESNADEIVNLKSKGSTSTSPAKASPSQSTRVVTRSSSGRALKRKQEETDTVDAKRTRRSSGTTDRENDLVSLSMECEEIETKDSYSDVEVVSSGEESFAKEKFFKDKKEEEKIPDTGIKREKSFTKTPVVLLTKPSVKSSKKYHKTPSKSSRSQKHKTDSHKITRRIAGNFYSVRGEKGRFISREQASSHATQPVSVHVESASEHKSKKEKNKPGSQPQASSDATLTSACVDSSGVSDVTGKSRFSLRRQSNSATTVISIVVDSDSDDEPLIEVQRRASKEEEEESAILTSKPEPRKEADTAQSVQTLAGSKSEAACGTDTETDLKLDFSSIPSELTFSHPIPGSSMAASPARSDGSTPKKRGRPKKPDGSPVVNKKSKKRNKGPKKLFSQMDSADDSFKSMKLSRTLNHLQSKKKGDNSQSSGPFAPFVRVQGKRSMPSKVSVFNHPPASIKDSKSVNKKKNVSNSGSPTTTIQITNFSSDKTVMVPSSKTTENSWICALCGKRSSYRFLGDLFGPYYLESHLPTLTKSEVKKDGRQDSFGSSEVQNAHNTRRKSLGYRRTSSVEEPAASIPQEVWVHEDCAMWSSGVYVIGSSVYGLEEALKAASATVCSCCREKGAMVGCLHKGCNQNFHYICAVDKACFLDVENLSILCPKHKDKRAKSATAASTSSQS